MSRLDEPREKVERARGHLAELNREITAFLRQRPYAATLTFEPRSGLHTACVQRVEGPPLKLGTIAGDLVHNLRSALDVLANQLVIANGGRPTERTKFPIARDRSRFEVALNSGAVAGMHSDAIRTIRQLRPYCRANRALWRIHCLDITDKHRAVIPAVAPLVKYDVTRVINNVHTRLASASGSRQLRQDLERAEFSIGLSAEMLNAPDVRVDLNVEAEVMFGKPKLVRGEVMRTTLAELVRYTEDVVSQFEPVVATAS
jgi:hypothetical protein